MIYWIRRILSAIARFFDADWHARIDPNAKCPACGNHAGQIKFDSAERRIEHLCGVCGARWTVDPITGMEAWKI